MNQLIIGQVLTEKEEFQRLLIIRVLFLIESKHILTTRFTKQLSELQTLGCSEYEASLVKNIHRTQIQKIDNEIVETQNELRTLKES